MAQIHILDSETIDKIAAGEVVERPSSVVKELVENAIDAGAKAVTVEAKDGGIELIRVTDDGCGMEREQLRRAFLRHATSKIQDAEDLARISSLGFRGEALSSIAAVARVEVVTKTQESLTGSRILLEGARETGFDEVGAPEGTTFLVRNLFFNTPVRRKFLKQPATEGGYIAALMEHLALSRPDISFKLLLGGQMKFHTSGNGDLREAAYRIYGRDVANALVPLAAAREGMRVEGFLGKPVLVRSNRNFELYFINGRFIRSNVVSRAVEEGYKEYLMQHKFPLCILHITMDAACVDVNVHPTKMDVRFSDSLGFSAFLTETVRQTLQRQEMIPEALLTSERELRARRAEEKKEREAKRPPEPFERRRGAGYRVMEEARYEAEIPGAQSLEIQHPERQNPAAEASGAQHPATETPETQRRGKQDFADNPVWKRVKSPGAGLDGEELPDGETAQRDTEPPLSGRADLAERLSGVPGGAAEAPGGPDRTEGLSGGPGRTGALPGTLAPAQAVPGQTAVTGETFHGAGGPEELSHKPGDNLRTEEMLQTEAEDFFTEVCESPATGGQPDTDPTGQPAQAGPDSPAQPPQSPSRPQPADSPAADPLQSPLLSDGVQMELFEDKILTADNRKKFRIIGQVFETYWLIEFEDKLLMIDQHAAHEKVNYERLMKQYREKAVVSQRLMPPVIVSLSGQEESVLREHLEVFLGLGFEIEEFGGSEYALRGVPMDLYGCGEREMFLEVLDGLAEGSLGGIRVIEEKIASMSCKAAVKGNNRLSFPEAQTLIDELLTLDNPYNCPHGRPTIVAMTKGEMDRKFKRIVS